jgi:hypothetical protein
MESGKYLHLLRIALDFLRVLHLHVARQSSRPTGC